MEMGTRYELPRQMTATPMNALKAADEPKYKQLSPTWTATRRRKALTGISCFAETLLKKDDPGMPPSRENLGVRG
jgi:hypothetical protein